MNLFLKDPKTGIPSVSLTLLLVAFALIIGASILSIFQYTQDTSALLPVFYSLVCLYFGRSLNIKGSTYGSEQAEQIVNKIEQETK